MQRLPEYHINLIYGCFKGLQIYLQLWQEKYKFKLNMKPIYKVFPDYAQSTVKIWFFLVNSPFKFKYKKNI